MENKRIDIEITELFMYKAGMDWHRRFMGTIKRMVDNDGIHFVYGQVEVNDCTIYAKAPDEEQLGEQIDEMVLMVLDYKLDYDKGVNAEIGDFNYFLN